MKIIFFSGLKGGTGKTTLSIYLCNYLHFHQNKNVCLVNFDNHRLLSLLAQQYHTPYPVIECKIEEYNDTFLSGFNYDFLVVDMPGMASIERSLLMQWEKADAHILPYLSSSLDFYKLQLFFQLIQKQKLALRNTFLLPNKFNKQAGTVMRANLKQQSFFQQSFHLPYIINSSKIAAISFSPLNSTILNYLRPSFIAILNKS